MSTLLHLSADRLPRITYLGKNKTDKYWKHFRRNTNEYIFFFITKGTMYLQEENNEYVLKQGDCLMLEPGKEHWGNQASACEYFFVHFPDDTFFPSRDLTIDSQRQMIQSILQLNYNESLLSPKLYAEVSILFPKHCHPEQASVIQNLQNLMNQAISYSTTKPLYHKTSSSVCLMSVFEALSLSWLSSHIQKEHLDISNTMYEKTNQLLQYLHIHYPEKITSSQLEQLFAVNFDYLNRSFKRRTGSPIFTYLQTLRLEQARQLLTTTYLRIGEIAARTGFSDEYYFSRTFKRHLSMTPSQYRKSQLGS